MNILTTQSLTIGYKRRKKTSIIAQDLNLHLEMGKLVCLIGRNGAGKSTLIQTLAAILPALKGQICINGQQIHKISSQKLAQQIALVLTTSVVANFSVEELVGTARYPYTGQFGLFSKRDLLHIKRALSDTKMTNFAQRKMISLSDGEQQKVMITRALAQDTPLIILDEPTAHLDLPNRVMIFEILKDLTKKAKKAILVSTHELDLALQVADEIWLQNDQTIQTGLPEELILNGAFESVFRRNALFFEKNTGRFKIVHPEKFKIHVAIEGLTGIWTKHAVERIGGKNVTDIKYPIIHYHKISNKWTLQTSNAISEHGSLTDLINKIEKSVALSRL